jgi:hypothetical protein
VTALNEFRNDIQRMLSIILTAVGETLEYILVGHHHDFVIEERQSGNHRRQLFVIPNNGEQLVNGLPTRGYLFLFQSVDVSPD